jgi:hypothetical protein
VDVLVLGAVELAGVQYNIEFDEDNLELLDVIEGDLLSKKGVPPVFNVGGIVSKPGTLDHVCSAVLGDKGANGLGRLLTLQFLVVGSGRAQVAVTDAILVDVDDVAIYVDFAGTVLNGPVRAGRPVTD